MCVCVCVLLCVFHKRDYPVVNVGTDTTITKYRVFLNLFVIYCDNPAVIEVQTFKVSHAHNLLSLAYLDFSIQL